MDGTTSTTLVPKDLNEREYENKSDIQAFLLAAVVAAVLVYGLYRLFRTRVRWW